MRLIDVDALKADYGMKDDCADCDREYRGKSKSCEFDRIYSKMDFCGWLDDARTVDAVPVRRGRWIIYVVSPFDGEDVKCSECGTSGCAPYWDYCPHCGAKMEESDAVD